MTASSVDPIAALRELARKGQPAAMLALGRRLLVGDGVGQAVDEGAALVAEAASRGDADAHVLLAVFAAFGILQPRNFPAALDSLLQAALLGSTQARRELQLLARGSGEDWHALRRSVDVAALTTPATVRTLREHPRILVIDHFASPAECDWLLGRCRAHLHPAMVYHGSARLATSAGRTNTEADYTIFNSDVLLALLRERMAVAAGVASTHFEVTKLLHYERGEQFGLHGDFLELNTPELAREVEVRGQRAATFLTYLNDDYEGGETEFPKLGIRHRGRRGSALLFHNVDGSGRPDYSTVHAGRPPVTGEKWLLSQWIRTRPVSG
jgi:prolyl 4-hydroxylase